MPSPRLRSRTRRVPDWPLSVEAELAAGVDLTAFRSPLAKIAARRATRMHAFADPGAPARLRFARSAEGDFRIRFPDGPPARHDAPSTVGPAFSPASGRLSQPEGLR